MKTLFIVLFTSLAVGCASGGQLLDTTTGQVAEGNIFSFRDTVVKVNPDFNFIQINDKDKIPGNDIDTGFPDIYRTENIYLFFALDDYNKVIKAAMINLVQLSDSQIRWDQRVDLLKDVQAIQKGKENIDGKEHWYWVSKCLALSEKVYFALEDEGFRLGSFRCWLTKSYATFIGIDSGTFLTITYMEGLNNCHGLDHTGQYVGSYWGKKIAEFCERLSENIQISHN